MRSPVATARAQAGHASLPEREAAALGDCRDCGRRHSLPFGAARDHAHALMREFEALKRLDGSVPAEAADPLLSFDHLFSDGHGNMFGVLECRDASGRTVVLRAFSSLRRGIRQVEGWVPPILSAETFYGLVLPTQQAIEEMTASLARLPAETDAYRALEARRRSVSQELMQEMKGQYRFQNFRGEERALPEAFHGKGGIPGGVGECCAPKLLNYAARRGLRPVGLAEFYWGGPRGGAAREQGQIYSACVTRCQPILGFLLCGLDDAE